MKHAIDDAGSTAALERPEEKSGSWKSDADKAEMMKKMEAAARRTGAQGARSFRGKLEDGGEVLV